MQAENNVYVLQLSNGKFYVGRTADSESRIRQHFSGYGSAWTRLHPPLQVLEVHSNVPIAEENEITKRYMQQHGWQNVRGGAYSQVDLREEDLLDKHKEVLSDADRCLICGRHGHWANQCFAKTRVLVCHRCGQQGHIAPQCGLRQSAKVSEGEAEDSEVVSEESEDSEESEVSEESEASEESEDAEDSEEEGNYKRKEHFWNDEGKARFGRGKPRRGWHKAGIAKGGKAGGWRDRIKQGARQPSGSWRDLSKPSGSWRGKGKPSGSCRGKSKPSWRGKR